MKLGNPVRKAINEFCQNIDQNIYPNCSDMLARVINAEIESNCAQNPLSVGSDSTEHCLQMLSATAWLNADKLKSLLAMQTVTPTFLRSIQLNIAHLNSADLNEVIAAFQFFKLHQGGVPSYLVAEVNGALKQAAERVQEQLGDLVKIKVVQPASVPDSLFEPTFDFFLQQGQSEDSQQARQGVLGVARLLDNPNNFEDAKVFFHERGEDILAVVNHVLEVALAADIPDLDVIVAVSRILRFGIQFDVEVAGKFAAATLSAFLLAETGGSPLLVYLLTKASMKGLEEAGKLIDALVENIPQEQFAEEVLKLSQQNGQALPDVIGQLTDIANDENAAGQAVAIKFLQYIMDDARLKDLFVPSQASHVETSSQRSFFAAKYLNVVASGVYSLAATSSNSVDGSSSDMFGDNQPTEWDSIGAQLELLYPVNLGKVQFSAGVMGAFHTFVAIDDYNAPNFKTAQLMGDLKLTFPIATHFGFAISLLAGWQFYFMESSNWRSFSDGVSDIRGFDFKDFGVLTFGAKAEAIIPLKGFWGISLGAQFIDAQEGTATEDIYQHDGRTGVIPADGRFELMAGPIFSW